MHSVYIETTIPSFFHESRSDPTIVAWRRSTRRWWKHHRTRYRVVTSQFVVDELEQSPEPQSKKLVALLAGIERLAPPARLDEVIRYYISQRLMPSGARGDAAHLAMASLCGIDFLLTWNCRHLANMNKSRHLRVLNGRLGISVPILATPDTLLPEVDQ